MISNFKFEIFKRSKKLLALSLAMLSLSSNVNTLRASEPNPKLDLTFPEADSGGRSDELEYDDSSIAFYHIVNEETIDLFKALGYQMFGLSNLYSNITNGFNVNFNDAVIQSKIKFQILALACHFKEILRDFEGAADFAPNGELNVPLDPNDITMSIWRLFATGVVRLAFMMNNKNNLDLYTILENETCINIPERGFNGLKVLFEDLELQLQNAHPIENFTMNFENFLAAQSNK